VGRQQLARFVVVVVDGVQVEVLVGVEVPGVGVCLQGVGRLGADEVGVVEDDIDIDAGVLVLAGEDLQQVRIRGLRRP
jgi:hypothetical protein